MGLEDDIWNKSKQPEACEGYRTNQIVSGPKTCNTKDRGIEPFWNSSKTISIVFRLWTPQLRDFLTLPEQGLLWYYIYIYYIMIVMGHLPTVQPSCVTNSWMMLMDCLAIASKNTTSTKPILPQHQAKLATSCGISSVTIFDTSATTFSISCLLRKPSTARLQAVFVKFLGEHQLRASTTHGCASILLVENTVLIRTLAFFYLLLSFRVQFCDGGLDRSDCMLEALACTCTLPQFAATPQSLNESRII